MRYGDMFPRIETPAQRCRTIGEFEGLQVRACPFTSDQGKRLAGYRYAKAGVAPKAVAIIAPGFGVGGPRVYLDVAGFDRTMDWLAYALGDDGPSLLPQMESTERALFGPYAAYTAADGFAHTHAPVILRGQGSSVHLLHRRSAGVRPPLHR